MAFLVIVILLLLISYQDFKDREVYWFLFPVLAIITVFDLFNKLGWYSLLLNFSINLIFVLIDLALISLYFSLKKKQIINIFDQFIGWGDVVFFVNLGLFFSPLNFLIFFFGSILLCLIGVFIFSGKRLMSFKIPLAGIQSILVLIALVLAKLVERINLQDDSLLLSFIGVWVR